MNRGKLAMATNFAVSVCSCLRYFSSEFNDNLSEIQGNKFVYLRDWTVSDSFFGEIGESATLLERASYGFHTPRTACQSVKRYRNDERIARRAPASLDM